MNKSRQQLDIDKIRRDKFNLDEYGRRVVESSLVEDLQSAIELLSQGLYQLDMETQAGRYAVDRGQQHEGWDIDSRDSNGYVRRIEVKSTKYAWGDWSVGLTAPQYRAAQLHGQDYYLYVVEHTLDPDQRRLYVIQDPAGKVFDFRSDDLWKNVAQELC